jgi:hypothetical protein
MDKFCAFILSHGRADRVITYQLLRKSGYTGQIRVVIDDGDPEMEEYQRRYPGEVLIFNKQHIADQMDEGGNFGNRKTIVYARNACWQLARDNGFDSFIQLDDDYTEFRHKLNSQGHYVEGVRGSSVKTIVSLDQVLEAMVRFVRNTPFLTVAMAQGGDFIGGGQGDIWRRPKRKAMNSFVCLTERPFKFLGRVNEDVNAYTNLGHRGDLLLTCMWIALQQLPTQNNPGGMTDEYLNSGTYVKSFYSVLWTPSAVRVTVMNSKHPRIHHQVRWRNCVPKILRA